MGSDIGQIYICLGARRALGLGGEHKNKVSVHLEKSRRERGKQSAVENLSQELGVSLEEIINSFLGAGWRV